jgi:apolipoprotein N-acyltransferase
MKPQTMGQLLLALVAGAVLPLAFAPFHLYPLAVLSPAVLFWLWRQADRRLVMWSGYLYGLGLFGVGASWVHVSINEFGHTGLLISVPLTVLFIAGMALFLLLAGYVVARIPASATVRTLLVMPAVWVLTEWFRSWFLTGFPWLLLGVSQTDSALAGFAPLFGSYGISWILAILAALLVQLYYQPRRYGPLLLAAVLVFAAGGYGLNRIEWVQALHPVRVTILQGNISQHDKWKREQRQPTLDLYSDMSRQHWDSDLIIWPETAVPALLHMVQDGFIEPLRQDTVASGSQILTGIAVMNLETQQYYNSVLSLGTDYHFYHKRHLVPFGEYVPLDAWLRGLIKFFNLPMSSFSAGDNAQTLMPYKYGRLGMSICYEVAYDNEILRALPDASLLVTVSNDAWFGDSLAPYQHLQIARMRAMETGRPMLRATNTGISAIIDHQGHIQQELGLDQRGAVTDSVMAMTGSTPFVSTGHLPVVILMLLLLLAAWLVHRRSSAA